MVYLSANFLNLNIQSYCVKKRMLLNFSTAYRTTTGNKKPVKPEDLRVFNSLCTYSDL